MFENDKDGARRKMFHQHEETSWEGTVKEENRGKRKRERRILEHNYKENVKKISIENKGFYSLSFS